MGNADERIAIWWLSENACKAIGEPHWYEKDKDDWSDHNVSPGNDDEGIYWLDYSPLPEYISKQLSSRYGRSGRGRLWGDGSIPLNSIEWPDDNMLAKWANHCGGIIFWRKDLDIVKGFPGFVTDTKFNRLY